MGREHGLRVLHAVVLAEYTELGLEERRQCSLLGWTQAGLHRSELLGARVFHAHGKSLHYEILQSGKPVAYQSATSLVLLQLLFWWPLSQLSFRRIAWETCHTLNLFFFGFHQLFSKTLILTRCIIFVISAQSFTFSTQLDAFVCFSVCELRFVVPGKRGKCSEVLRICCSKLFEFALLV